VGREACCAAQNWTPALRLLAGAAGGGSMLNCLRNPSLVNVALGTVGFGLFSRATANMGPEELLGTGQAAGGIELRESIVIDAPVEEVR
jgi:uncharacterized membrane protein